MSARLPYPHATTNGLSVEEIIEFSAEKILVSVGATWDAFARYAPTEHHVIAGVELKLLRRLPNRRFEAELDIGMFFSSEELVLRARLLQAVEDSKVEF
jgi:hypothetical protein